MGVWEGVAVCDCRGKVWMLVFRVLPSTGDQDDCSTIYR